MDWYIKVIKQYADFSGRARRKEYWMFLLISTIISVILTIVESVIGGLGASGVGILSVIYGLAVLIPSFAVSIRRLHDTSHSGWWILVLLVPLIRLIVYFYYLVKDGDPGKNEYGDNPKNVRA